MFDLTENGMNPQTRFSGGIESAPDDSFVSESTISQTRSCAFRWPREGKSSKPDELIGWGVAARDPRWLQDAATRLHLQFRRAGSRLDGSGRGPLLAARCSLGCIWPWFDSQPPYGCSPLRSTSLRSCPKRLQAFGVFQALRWTPKFRPVAKL